MREGDLPRFEGIREDLRMGRSVRDGYARGWGLQFGELRNAIANDPLYREAERLASGRTLVSADNRMNLFLLLRFYAGKLPPGHVVEFGAYRGGNAIFMAWICRALHPGMAVYALDTFEGMPEVDREIDAHRARDFRDVEFDELRRSIDSLGLDNLHLVRGRFEDTAPSLLREIGSIRLSHVDCDIRSAVAYAYEASKPYMVDGGYVVFDDALYSSCLGATEVVEEIVIRRDGLHSEQIFPHFVFRTWASRG